jgi:hypothetical protein
MALIAVLVDWARACALPVVAAGKGTRYLPHFHRSTPATVWAHYGLSPERAAAGGMNPRCSTPDSHLDPADRPEGRENAGGIIESFFHPSRPSGFGYPIQGNTLARRPKLVRGVAGRQSIRGIRVNAAQTRR